MVVQAYNPSIWGVEAGVQSYVTQLYIEFETCLKMNNPRQTVILNTEWCKYKLN